MKPSYLPLLIAAALAGLSTTAQASGYRFGSQSVSGQGSADANGAEASDASTIFYNPAGLSRLEGTQLLGGGTLVLPHSTFQDTGSRTFTNRGGNSVSLMLFFRVFPARCTVICAVPDGFNVESARSKSTCSPTFLPSNSKIMSPGARPASSAGALSTKFVIKTPDSRGKL